MMAIIKKTKIVRENVKERDDFSWWECKLVQPLWKTVWRFLKNLKIKLSKDLPILLLSIYPKKKKTLIFKRSMHPTFIAALFTIAKI